MSSYGCWRVWEVTTKAVERGAEAIGTDLAAREQEQIQRAVQLPLPQVTGADIPILYIEMDGTGVPLVAAETIGRPGKDGAERARTREVKLGCVFTQSRLDTDGRPLRDEASTSYTAAIEAAEQFGRRIWQQAWQRGWSRAKKKVVIGDGAVWIWNLSHQYFADAVEIVDLYHARQHLWELAAQLWPDVKRGRRRWAKKRQGQLDRGKIEQLVVALRGFAAPQQDLARRLATEADYFERNAARMRYPSFRKQRLLHRLGSNRGGLQDRDCPTPQAIGHVLDRTRRQCHCGAALCPPQRPLRRLLGKPRPGRLIGTNMSHTQRTGP